MMMIIIIDSAALDGPRTPQTNVANLNNPDSLLHAVNP